MSIATPDQREEQIRERFQHFRDNQHAAAITAAVMKALNTRPASDLPGEAVRCGCELLAPIVGNEMTVRAAFSGGEGVSAVSSAINVAYLAGYRSAVDTTQGWVREIPLTNFHAAKVATSQRSNRLHPMARGKSASTAMISVQHENWRLRRYAAQFTIDTADLADAESVNAILVAVTQLGAASRQLRPDLIYSMLLANDTMADGGALFNATAETSTGGHNNLATGALAETTLSNMIGLMSGKVLRDSEGDAVHVNLRPRYLLVPPQLAGAARSIARGFKLDDGYDLIVRPESRLSSVGVVDPTDDSIITGTNSNYLIAASADQTPGVVVGLMDGATEPTIRPFKLDKGQWGVGFDISFDIAATVVDHRPLCWSTGV